MTLLRHIESAHQRGEKWLAVLLDPERLQSEDIEKEASLLNQAQVNLVLVGGSKNVENMVGFIDHLKRFLQEDIPVVLFPGDLRQFAPNADALLFLSLLSGRNAEYLVGQQVRVAKRVKESGIESIPMGYILVEGGRQSAVERVSETRPIADEQEVLDTAVAAELMGKSLIYLEAGSGALTPIPNHLIRKVREQTTVPIFVGGGICSIEEMNTAFDAGADIVVIGNHFEQYPKDILLFAKQKR